MTEHYYAIQIGKKPKYAPYLMLERDRLVPELFSTKVEAKFQCPDDPDSKVVRVKITWGRQKK